MRLPQAQIIKKCILEFDSTARIYLFGSRVDDSKRGGDIDLLILSHQLRQTDSIQLRLKLFESIGEQKIDLIIADTPKTPFERLAFSTGVEL